jgi:Ser/Thr protein kinase RdoA (MazF antagonist)
MTWDEHRRRNAALDAVLAYAAEQPLADLPLAELPGLVALFGDRRGLVLALQNRWAQLLWLRLSVGERNEGALHSAQVWRECAAANPVLRRLLDRHLPELGDASMERYEVLIPA